MTKSIYLFALLLVLGSCGDPGSSKEQSTLEGSSLRSTPVDWSKDAIIYEVNLRQHTEQGTLAAFTEDLPRIATLGANVLWFMPVHPIGIENRKGTLGSYYSISDYRGINPEFGTMDDFKAMLAKAHALGMKVLIDWVANHTAWDHYWVESNPDFYTRDSLGQMIPPIGTDWSDVTQLNYDNPALREAMLADMRFWIEEVGIDGFRCDVADWVPLDFWQEARKALDAIQPIFMLAESENPDHHLQAFDATYSWELFHLMTEIGAGNRTALALDSMFERNKARFALEDYRLNFITNHDENSWKETPEALFGERQKAFAVLTFTLPGSGLLYSGQEANNTKMLEFFEKDAIVWGDYAHQDFYQKLTSLKKNHPALWNGAYGAPMERLQTGADEQVFAFTRSDDSHRIWVYINLSGDEVGILYNDDLSGAREYFSGTTPEAEGETLDPGAYRIYIR
jgi:glycosidase